MLALAAVGCSSVPSSLNRPSPVTARIAVSVGAAKGYRTQATVHRWVASDVYSYDLSLADGSSSGAPVVATTSILAQGSPNEAVFSHLSAGHLYQATIQAMGNVGGQGSSPLQVLNTQTPATVDIDLLADQNLPTVVTATATVTLDSVPFSGTLTVPVGAPSGTATVSATLFDSLDMASPLVTQTFSGTPQAVVFDNLGVGIPYEATLSAYEEGSGGLETATASTDAFTFDAQQNDLSTTATARTSSWSAWQSAGP